MLKQNKLPLVSLYFGRLQVLLRLEVGKRICLIHLVRALDMVGVLFHQHHRVRHIVKIQVKRKYTLCDGRHSKRTVQSHPMAFLSKFTQHATPEEEEKQDPIRLSDQTNEQTPFVHHEQHDCVHEHRRWLSGTSVVLINTLLLVLITLCIYFAIRPERNPVASGLELHDVSIVGNKVQVGTHTHTFSLDARHAGPPSNSSDEMWDALMPQGRGFVSLETMKQDGVPGSDILGREVDPASSYCVAAFHQLHCLWWLRTGFYSAVRNETVHFGHVVSKTVPGLVGCPIDRPLRNIASSI